MEPPKPFLRTTQGNFILRVRREETSYRFTLRDLRTGDMQRLETWQELEHHIRTLLKEGLR